MEEAASRAQYGEKEKDQRKELEDMLTSLGIAPPSGKNIVLLFCSLAVLYCEILLLNE